MLNLATLILTAATASTVTDLSVRTPNTYVAGAGCDPEIVQLIVPSHNPSQVGVVDAACASVTTTPEPNTPDKEANTGGVTVTLDGVTYAGCRLTTMQRNHYGDVLYTAWGYTCPSP